MGVPLLFPPAAAPPPPEPPPPPPPVPAPASDVAPATTAAWRLILCDPLGNPLSNITPVADNRSGSWRLNRPATLRFRVPSNDPRVATLHTDGRPFLEEGTRWVKAFRRENQAGSWVWVLRFAGVVWDLQDVGSPEVQHTEVTCFDPLHVLTKRLVRDHPTSNSAGSPIHVTSLGGGTYVEDPGAAAAGMIGTNVVKHMINLANTHFEQLPVTTAGGTFDQTVAWRVIDWRFKTMSDAIRELTDAWGGFDIKLDYLDSTDGYFARMNAYARAGTARPHVVFGWGVGSKNVTMVSRFKTSDSQVNRVYMHEPQFGTDSTTPPVVDQASLQVYGVREDVRSFNNIYYDQLAYAEVQFRRLPREVVQFTPAAGLAPVPWDDFEIGDTVTVNAGAQLRGGFSGVQRVYGWEIQMGDVETVTQVLTSPE